MRAIAVDTGPSERSAQIALTIQGLSKVLGQRTLFANVDLRLERGCAVAIVGDSGCGKSSLLNLVAGLDRPDGGHIQAGDILVSALSEDAAARWRRANVGFVFQAFHLLQHLTLLDNVALPLQLNGVSARAARELAGSRLLAVGLGERRHAYADELSGGEMQRVAIARALVHSPPLLLADEPTGNLAPGQAREIIDLLLTEVRARGAACLLVTHSALAAGACDRVLRLGVDGLHE